MNGSLRRSWIIRLVLPLAAALLLAGCSALRLAYHQGPELMFWWLDGYFDIQSEQAPRLRDALHEWFAWHRREELPTYAALLARAEREVSELTTPAAVCGWLDEGQRRVEAALDRAAPALAEQMLMLTPAQIEHVRQRFRKSNDEFREDYLQPDPAERADAALQRTVERVEMLYGSLQPAQREPLARGVAASPFDAERWWEERQKRQQDLLQLLQQVVALRAADRDAARARAESGVRELSRRLWRSPRDAYRDYAQSLREYNCTFIAQIHNATTRAQRDRARAKLRGWEEDVRALALDGG